MKLLKQIIKLYGATYLIARLQQIVTKTVVDRKNANFHDAITRQHVSQTIVRNVE